MQSAIQNYSLTTGWDVGIDWQDFNDDTGQRDLRIRNIEADLATGRLYFNAGMKQLRALMLQLTQYGMLPNNAIPDCIARVADALLPQSIAREMDDEDEAWNAVRERDKYNMIYGRGQYARPEPEPEEEEAEYTDPNDEPYNELGLENILGGLNG